MQELQKQPINNVENFDKSMGDYKATLTKYDNDLISSTKKTHSTLLRNEKKFYSDLEKEYKNYYEAKHKYLEKQLETEAKQYQKHQENMQKSSSEGNESLFNIDKSAKLATAILELPSTVSSAFYQGTKIGGPIVGATMATAAATTQIQNINAIKATSFSSENTSYSDSSNLSTDTASLPSSSLKEIKIEVNGEIFSRGQVRALLEKIQTEIKNGYPLKF